MEISSHRKIIWTRGKIKITFKRKENKNLVKQNYR